MERMNSIEKVNGVESNEIIKQENEKKGEIIFSETVGESIVESDTRIKEVEFPDFLGEYDTSTDEWNNIEFPETLGEINLEDIVSKAENTEVKEKKGGSYKEVFKEGEGDTKEVHHIPADSASDLSRNDGPAIKMEKEDHKKTASCGNSKEAREYRDKQRKLIEDGKFREAVQMDIDDIRDKFGDKYDEEIAEMEAYVDQLEAEGNI